MATSPHLVRVDDEYRLDVSVGRTGRRRLAISDRAEALLVDELRYGNRDVLPWLTTKALVLAGGASRRGETTDPSELAWAITGADGAPRATDEEVERLAAYLRRVDVDHRAADAIRELAAGTRLSEVLSREDVRSRRGRTNDLRGIAKDL